MPIPRWEPLTGAVDGLNTVFTTSLPYTPGSTAVVIRGLWRVRTDDDGWFETNPATGTVTLKEAPLLGDNQPQIVYLDTTPTSLETEVSEISGQLIDASDNFGSLAAEADLTGGLKAEASLAGELAATVDLTATLNEVSQITGKLEEC